MAGFESDLLATPSPKKKWTDTAVVVVLGLIIAFFCFAVLSGAFQLVFQRSIFGK